MKQVLSRQNMFCFTHVPICIKCKCNFFSTYNINNYHISISEQLQFITKIKLVIGIKLN